MKTYLSLYERTKWTISLLTVALFFAGCDLLQVEEDASPLLFQNVEHTPYGQAQLSLGQQSLTVSPVGQQAGVTIHTNGRAQGDLIFRPVSIAPEGAFTAVFEGTLGGASQTLARVRQRTDANGKARLEVDMSALGARTATVECTNRGQRVYRKKGVRMRPPKGDGGNDIPVGDIMGAPTSVHYDVVIIDGETYIVATVDYEDDGGNGPVTSAQFTPAADAGSSHGCTHISFIPEQGVAEPITVERVKMMGTNISDITLVRETFGD